MVQGSYPRPRSTNVFSRRYSTATGEKTEPQYFKDSRQLDTYTFRLAVYLLGEVQVRIEFC